MFCMMTAVPRCCAREAKPLVRFLRCGRHGGRSAVEGGRLWPIGRDATCHLRPAPPCLTNALSNEHFRSDRIFFGDFIESALARRAKFPPIFPVVPACSHYLSPCWGPPRRQPGLEEGVMCGGKALGSMAGTLIWMPRARRVRAGDRALIVRWTRGGGGGG